MNVPLITYRLCEICSDVFLKRVLPSCTLGIKAVFYCPRVNNIEIVYNRTCSYLKYIILYRTTYRERSLFSHVVTY